MEESEPALKQFCTQLYLAARPSDRNMQTMDRMKKPMIFICYLLASLNNTKINAFKFQIAYYLDSAGTSNEGLNTMANIGITTTARSVDRRKKQMSDAHTKYAENALQPYEQTALILNVDDYHNIHTQRKPDTSILCDFELCDQSHNLCDGKILACGHGYHNHCLEQCQNKCVICLEYLQEEIEKNVDAVIMNMTKESADISIDATNDNTAEDDLNNVDEAIDNILVAEILLERAKISFQYVFLINIALELIIYLFSILNILLYACIRGLMMSFLARLSIENIQSIVYTYRIYSLCYSTRHHK